MTARRVLLGLALVVGALPAASSAQVQTCGQGVVLRADGALVIDAWTTYAMPPMSAPGAPTPAPPTTLSGLKPTAHPTRVILGPSLPGDLSVCVETAAGSKCIALNAVRIFIGK